MNQNGNSQNDGYDSKTLLVSILWIKEQNLNTETTQWKHNLIGLLRSPDYDASQDKEIMIKLP